jgi:hypothetical protein
MPVDAAEIKANVSLRVPFPHVSRELLSVIDGVRHKGAAQMLTEVKSPGNKIRRTFLCEILCGVIVAATLTFLVAIPANNTHWQIEIVKRGGGAWFFDKNGRIGWMWTVEPTSGAPQKKQIIVPAPRTNVAPQRL